MSAGTEAHGSGINLTRAEYLLFQELIGQASGLHLADGDWTALRVGLCERLTATGLAGFGEYYELLRSRGGAQELSRLIELLTIHETAFFRSRSHFDMLARWIVPELLDRNAGSRALRFWSAGCSTGQEAYSIAISLLESVPAFEPWQVEILATDISTQALETARAGVYSQRSVRSIDPLLLDRYFERCAEGYRVCDRLRRLVRFEYLNLVREPFPLAALRPCDAIFCENVTIYFKVESTRRVIRNFRDTLREGGYLFLGYSETLWNISDDFELREIGDSFVYQKTAHGARGDAPPSALAPISPAARAAPPLPPPSEPGRRVVREQPVCSARNPTALEEAVALYDSRRYEEALLAVEGVLVAVPRDPRAHLLAAKLRADREEVGPALRHCRKALEAEPLLEEGHFLMGVLLMRAGENREAGDALSRVIYLNASGHRAALAHFHLAGLRTDDNDRAAAAREYRNALRLLERLPRDELVGEFSADFLARVCRRRVEELERGT